MANSGDWQCRLCGDHPSAFAGDKPTSSGKCLANGANHVWEKIETGSTNSRDWQCLNCGAHPTSFVGSRPSPGGKCSVSGFKHVWGKI